MDGVISDKICHGTFFVPCEWQAPLLTKLTQQYFDSLVILVGNAFTVVEYIKLEIDNLLCNDSTSSFINTKRKCKAVC